MFMTRSPRSCTRLKTVHDTNYIHSFIWAHDGFISLMTFMDDVVSGFIFLMCWWWLMIWYDLICGWLGFYTDGHAFSHHYFLQYFIFVIYLSRHFFHLHAASERVGNGKAPLHAMYMWTCLLLAQGLFGFENFHICFSSFVLLHSDAKANLKPNHDVNDGFGMSCFEPSHLTKSKCGSGKIVWRCPRRGYHLFFSRLSPLQSFHGCICVFLRKHSGDRGCCIGFWVQGDVTLRALILLACHWNLARRISYFAPGWRSTV